MKGIDITSRKHYLFHANVCWVIQLVNSMPEVGPFHVGIIQSTLDCVASLLGLAN